MKKISELSSEVLRKYANNLERLDDITYELLRLNKEVKKLQEENEYMENEGKLPVSNFCSDDIPF